MLADSSKRYQHPRLEASPSTCFDFAPQRLGLVGMPFLVRANLRSEVRSDVFGRKLVRVHFFTSSVGPVVRRGSWWQNAVFAGSGRRVAGQWWGGPPRCAKLWVGWDFARLARKSHRSSPCGGRCSCCGPKIALKSSARYFGVAGGGGCVWGGRCKKKKLGRWAGRGGSTFNVCPSPMAPSPFVGKRLNRKKKKNKPQPT